LLEVENLSNHKVCERWKFEGYENIGRIFEKHSNVPKRLSSWSFQIGEEYTFRERNGR